MKVAFVGKGGSGKTTLTSLISRFLAYKHLPVVAIDADINQHLSETLGMSPDSARDIPSLGLEMGRIKTYLKGNNLRIENADSMIKTTPPGKGSRLLRVQENNPLFEYFARDINGIKLMAVGPFDADELGVKCYHSKTGSVELLLNHLVDKEREYILVDMTAGADSFASGLFTRFDITFLVVEPTLKSVGVYTQYKQYAEKYDVVIKVIGNKVQDKVDVDFIKKHVGKDLSALIYQSVFIKKADRGEVLPVSELETENKKSIEAVVRAIDAQKKDWIKFYRQAIKFHIKNAKSWANESFGKDLTSQIDPLFVFTP